MKRIAVIAALAALSPIFAAEIPLNGDFKKSSLNAPTPFSWVKNLSPKIQGPDAGVTKLFEKDGKRFFNVKSASKQIPFYNGIPFAVKPGEKITMSATVSGKGKIVFHAYGYGEKNKYLTTLPLGKPAEASAGKVQGSAILKADTKVKAVRMAFVIYPNSDINISDIKAETTEQK